MLHVPTAITQFAVRDLNVNHHVGLKGKIRGARKIWAIAFYRGGKNRVIPTLNANTMTAERTVILEENKMYMDTTILFSLKSDSPFSTLEQHL